MAALGPSRLAPVLVNPLALGVALAVLGIAIFLSPPKVRLAIVGVVIVMAVLQRGGDAAKIIGTATDWLYGRR